MGPVANFFRTVMHVSGRFWWVFPLLLVCGGYLVPALKAGVMEPKSDNLYLALLIESVLCGGWLISAMFHASNGNTAVSELKMDNFVSNCLAIGLTAWTAYSAAKGQLLWLFVLPTITAVIDSFVTGDRAINNAAMKPLVQQQTSKA